MAPVNNNIEEKSLSTQIEFTYQKSPGLFSFVKKMQIDLVSLICIILIIVTSGYTYLYKQSASKELKLNQQKAEDIARGYEALTESVKTVIDAKVEAIDWWKFLKIFDFLDSTNLDKYELIEDKKTWKYTIEVMELNTEILSKIIEDWIKAGVISGESKKTFMIMKPGLASAKIIFN